MGLQQKQDVMILNLKMNNPEIKNSEVVVFKPKGGQTEFQVVLDGNTKLCGQPSNKLWTCLAKQGEQLNII